MDHIDELDEKLDNAFNLVERGRLSDAMATVERCLAEFPTHPGAHALRGYILVLQNELDAAEAAAAKALSLDLDLAFAHFVSALVERTRGKPNHAVASGQRAIELEPEDLAYKIALAETYFEADWDAAGRALLDEIKEIEPFGPEVLLLRAQVAIIDGDPDEAASCAEAAVKLDSENLNARLALAQVALAKEEPKQAAEQASRALTLSPENWDALLLLTEALGRQGDFDAALAAIEKHAQNASNDEIILFERARILLLAGRIEPAKAAIEHAMRIAPQSAYLYYLEGHLNRDRGDILGQIASYERALGLDPGNFDTVRQLVLAYGQLGDSRKVRQIIDKVGSTASLDVGGLLYLAEIAKEAGHQDQARACVEAALERDPNNIEARLQSASLAILLNNFAKAREEVECILDQDPENQAAREMIDWLSSARGLKKLAMQCVFWVDRSSKVKLEVIIGFLGLLLFILFIFGTVYLYRDHKMIFWALSITVWTLNLAVWIFYSCRGRREKKYQQTSENG